MDSCLTRGLEQHQRDRFMAAFGPTMTFEKGQELYRPGSLGILLSGSAGIRRTGGNAAVTVRVIAAGEIFGAAGVFGSWQGKSSVVARGRVTVCYAEQEQLRAALEACPGAAMRFIAYLGDRIRFLNRRLDMLTAAGSEEKLYAFLTAQADEEGKVVLSFGLAELARRLQMGRSSLYRALDTLVETGVIAREKNVFTVL